MGKRVKLHRFQKKQRNRSTIVLVVISTAEKDQPVDARYSKSFSEHRLIRGLIAIATSAVLLGIAWVTLLERLN
jgi:hypothetical protein